MASNDKTTNGLPKAANLDTGKGGGNDSRMVVMSGGGVNPATLLQPGTMAGFSPEDKPSVEYDLDAMDAEIRNTIAKVTRGVAQDKVTQVISLHTQSSLKQMTVRTRSMLADLMRELEGLDDHLVSNELRLLAEIEHHVTMANSARQSANIISGQIAEWRSQIMLNATAPTAEKPT